MDIKKELDSNQTVLLFIPSTKYSEIELDIVKQLASQSICYVTLNKTYKALKELFTKHKIPTKNVIFIDAISKTIQQTPDQVKGCYYCSSPGSLTEISIAITKFLNHNFNYIIFDSLTSLLIYEKKAPVAKFVSSLVNKIRATKTKAVFFTLDVGEQGTLIKEAGMFMDKVVNLK